MLVERSRYPDVESVKSCATRARSSRGLPIVVSTSALAASLAITIESRAVVPWTVAAPRVVASCARAVCPARVSNATVSAAAHGAVAIERPTAE